MTDKERERKEKRRAYARAWYLKRHPNARQYSQGRAVLNLPNTCKRFAMWGECFRCPYPDCILTENNQIVKGLYPEGFAPHAQPHTAKKRERAVDAGAYKASKTAMTEADFAYVAEIFGIGER